MVNPAKEERQSNVKLDPVFMMVTARAEEENLGALADTAKTGAPAPATVAGLVPGIRSLQQQLSVTAVTALVERDVLPVIIEATDAKKCKVELEELECRCESVTANKLVAEVPREALASIGASDAVAYVEASTRLEPHVDAAHVSANLVVEGVRRVRQTGANVLVGVVDTGIDTEHEAFRKNGATRIVEYFDQNTGKAYNADAIDKGKAVASPDVIGHGTHVAGIAAGNGDGSPHGIYSGVAPEADLAIVKTTFNSADIALAVQRIFKRAGQRKQPCVVNLSLGGHVGGHDGTTVTERAIDELSGPGRLIVASAGNENQDSTHAATVLRSGSPTPRRWSADFRINSRTINNQNLGALYVQVWHQHEDEFAITLRAPDGELITPSPDIS